MEKRKTKTSSEVKARFNAKTYKSYTLNFRKDTDADIIEAVQKLNEQGLNNREAFAALIRQGLSKE